MTSSTIARAVWKLARNHTWGSPLPEEKLVDFVQREEDADEVRDILSEQVAELPFVAHSNEGYYIPNGQDAHVRTADWLREHTEINDFDIKATLSRLPEDWPTDDGSS